MALERTLVAILVLGALAAFGGAAAAMIEARAIPSHQYDVELLECGFGFH